MLNRLSHHTLAIPYFLAMVSSMMSARENMRPAKTISAGERERRNGRTRMQKTSRRRNRR